MKKFVYRLLTVMLFMCLLNLQSTIVKASQSKQHSYFSLDPNVPPQRVDATDFSYYFIDDRHNLCTIDDNSNVEIFLQDVVEIAASQYNSGVNFAVKTDGSLWSWSNSGSYNGSHTLGRKINETDVFGSIKKPEQILDKVSYVYVSNQFCYAILTDGSLWGWGFEANDYANIYLGNGGTKGSLKPIEILDNVVSITEVQAESYGSGAANMFAIKADSSLWAWGTNSEGALGLGDIKDALSPSKVMDDVSEFIPGDNSKHYIHSVFNYAIKKDGSLWAWGQNNRGNLGNGTTIDSNIPVKIMENVATAGLGMALKEDGSLWIWGTQTKTVQEISTFSAVPLKVLDNVSRIYAKDYTYYAVTNDGSLYIFDYEGCFTLQKGLVSYSKGSLMKLMDGVHDVFAEDEYGFALGDRVYVEKTDGSLWGWGKNFQIYPHGEINDDYKKTWYNRPQNLLYNHAVQRAYAGNGVEYTIMEDGSLWWYVLNYSETTPVLSAKIEDDVVQVATGHYDALILRKDGSVYRFNNANPEKNSSINISIDGTHITFPDAQPFIDENNRTQVPIGALAAILRAETGWDSGTKVATIKKDGVKMKIVIGDNKIFKDTAEIELDTAAIFLNNRTFVPIRYAAEAFNFLIAWDEKANSINLISPKS